MECALVEPIAIIVIERFQKPKSRELATREIEVSTKAIKQILWRVK